MFTSWSLENFKSVGPKVTLDFRPLTVFTGPNNSGKSTVLQSLLLTAQTVQSQVHARPVVLNAQMARLGDYSDIVHGGDLDRDVLIGFVLKLSSDYRRRYYRHPGHRRPHFYYPRFGHNATARIALDYSFGSKSSERTDRLQSQLETVTLEVQTENPNDDSDRLANIRATRAHDSPEKRLQEYSINSEKQTELELESLEFEVNNVFPRETTRQRRHLVDKKYIGATFDHFLPRNLSVVYDTIATEIRSVYKALVSPSSYDWDAKGEKVTDALRKPKVRSLLLSAVNDLIESSTERGAEESPRARYVRRVIERVKNHLNRLTQTFSPENWEKLYGVLPPSLRGALTEHIGKRETELKKALRAGRDTKYALDSVPLPELLRQGRSILQQQFGLSLYYLGPLRDEPKSIYPLAGSTDPNDVGLKGEHTAAVLDLNRDLTISNIRPDGPSDSIHGRAPQETTLIQAVIDWLQYVGVGSDVETTDQGKLGHELKVETQASHALHDLTQVGVGVSQVLPILVSSLLARPGAILIFEQPELHLHPRVQARLADFFVAMSELGKQCVIETHSEYLVNRLRYQIAKSEGAALADSVMLYFTEKSGAQSSYRPVPVNEFGKIEGWPEGFFDEGERLAASILRAGLKKRRPEQNQEP